MSVSCLPCPMIFLWRSTHSLRNTPFAVLLKVASMKIDLIPAVGCKKQHYISAFLFSTNIKWLNCLFQILYKKYTVQKTYFMFNNEMYNMGIDWLWGDSIDHFNVKETIPALQTTSEQPSGLPCNYVLTLHNRGKNMGLSGHLFRNLLQHIRQSPEILFLFLFVMH